MAIRFSDTLDKIDRSLEDRPYRHRAKTSHPAISSHFRFKAGFGVFVAGEARPIKRLPIFGPQHTEHTILYIHIKPYSALSEYLDKIPHLGRYFS